MKSGYSQLGDIESECQGARVGVPVRVSVIVKVRVAVRLTVIIRVRVRVSVIVLCTLGLQ